MTPCVKGTFFPGFLDRMNRDYFSCGQKNVVLIFGEGIYFQMDDVGMVSKWERTLDPKLKQYLHPLTSSVH